MTSQPLWKVLLRSSQVRWAVSGWAFFVAENAILSENRTYLIQLLEPENEPVDTTSNSSVGDRRYHTIYGFFSTLATASIGYSYYHLTRKTGGQVDHVALQLWNTAKSKQLVLSRPPTINLAAAWISMTIGLVMASQALPKMQVPVDSSFQVRCPFDFSDRKQLYDGHESLHGLERITRHPGLWSLALVSAAQASLQSSIPLRLWWLGPSFVAYLGGGHTDSRFRRGIGGNLDPYYDSMTSNLPFAATLSGKQGPVVQAVTELLQDIKPLNATIATGVATAWILSRGRVKPSLRPV